MRLGIFHIKRDTTDLEIYFHCGGLDLYPHPTR